MKNNQINQRKFVVAVNDFLESLPAVKKVVTHAIGYIDHSMSTEVGKLNISVPSNQEELFFVPMRFEHPEAAIKVVPCNPHSGKFNFTCTSNDWKVAFEEFKEHLNF